MANYPKEIKLSDKAKERLISYLDDEINKHLAEKQDDLRKLTNQQIDYWAEPQESEATFPFKGAATLIIPLAAITVEAIHARVMTTMFALDQFVTAKPVSPKWQDHSRPVEKFLDAELLERIGIKKPINDSLLEVTKYGTGIIKTGYEKITRTVVREIGGKEEEYTYLVKANASVDALPQSRFLMPFYYQDPQTAAWCGEEHEYSPYEMRQNELSGLFKEGTMDELNTHFSIPHSTDGGEMAKTQGELESREAVWPNTLKTYEIWCSFDVEDNEQSVVDGMIPESEFTNGFDKEIVVHYCMAARQILSCRYNWHEDLRRPYHVGIYFPVEHRWHGIGVCKQTEQFQQEITTQHRQRIDNATIANCRMIKINKLSDYSVNEPIFPGKIWSVDNMEDIQTFQMGEIYSSSYSNESQALQYVQMRTGINEVNLGMPQVGTPGTATSDLARIQEGNKKFDFTYRNNRDFVNSVLNSTILNIKQFGTRAETYYETVQGGDLVREFFAEDYEIIKHDLALRIQVAGQQDNKLLDRQNMQQIAQFTQQYWNGMIQLAAPAQDPALMQKLTQNAMRSATEIMKQILESFDLKNIDRIIFQEVLTNGSGQTSVPGAVAGPPPVSPPAGMVGGPNIIPPPA